MHRAEKTTTVQVSSETFQTAEASQTPARGWSPEARSAHDTDDFPSF